jgi:hypothetical protein
MAAAAKQEKKKEADWQLRNHPKANENREYGSSQGNGKEKPSRNHQSGRGREMRGSLETVVSTDQPDARFDSADPEQTDVKSRPRVDSIGAWSGHV